MRPITLDIKGESSANTSTKKPLSTVKKIFRVLSIIFDICFVLIAIFYFLATSGKFPHIKTEWVRFENTFISVTGLSQTKLPDNYYTADEIINAYTNNAVAADKIYGNREVCVVGIMHKVEKNVAGVTMVYIEPNLLFSKGYVIGFISDEWDEKVSQFNKGDNIELRGECSWNPLLNAVTIN